MSGADPSAGGRKLLTPGQLGEWLQVPKQTVYRWRSSGTGSRGYRIGKHLRYDVADVERWLSEQPAADQSFDLPGAAGVTMPKSRTEILAHGEEIADRFETMEPGDAHDNTPLREFADAVQQRVAAEQAIADAVGRARADGLSWSAISAYLGTFGEAARPRYATFATT